MAIRIIQFHIWLRFFPRSKWKEIREELYETGSISSVDATNWRFVRVMSGAHAKIGVVHAKDVPHVNSDEILWLSRCYRFQQHDYFMRTTSGWAGKVSNVVRYYAGNSCSPILEGLPKEGEPTR